MSPGSHSSSSQEVITYTAAGGVVVFHDRVLLLQRPARDEVRLPKGHIEPGEQAAAAALREVAEESGTAHLRVLAPLGTQLVEFESGGKRYSRTEIYFLMTTTDEPHRDHSTGEAQFVPVWLSFAEAVQVISFEAEREWLKRARHQLRRIGDDIR
ncbi:MAG: NUDIX domain-containing protein [Calditrichaeota bacterium]|nr:MAG: NUDIX domain-containing protein [Calditrichota bacterium]